MTSRRTRGERKQRAAAVSVWSNLSLTGIKLAAAVLTRSVSILSEALHSGLDLVAAMMAFLAIRKAREPADADHQFGHGKFESMSGLAESLLILVAVVLILWASMRRLISGETELVQAELGIAVMAVSAVVNVFVSRMLFRVARETDSIALEADAWHLRTDVWTSAGVFVGLAAITVATRLGLREAHHLDPVIAIAVGMAIARAALQITRRSWTQLVDRALPASEVERIENLLRDHYPQFAGYHGLRTRQAGSHRYVDLHLVVAGELAVEEAHALCDHLESDVGKLIPGAEVMIHVEPKQRDE